MSKTSDKKIWVGSIPYHVEEQDFRNVMSRYGKITEFYFNIDNQKMNRSWAFITYSTREEAISAIQSMDNSIFSNSDHPIEVRFANKETHKEKENAENTSHYIYNNMSSFINESTYDSENPEYKRSTFSESATGPALWHEYFTDEGYPYYYNSISGHVQWEKPYPPKEYQEAMGINSYVPPRATKSYGPPGANLFVFHIPSNWTGVDLQYYFNAFGNIVSSRISTDPLGKNSGFGFVSFDSPSSAIAAIKVMNGYNVKNKYLKVQLKKGEEHLIDPELKDSLQI